MTQLKYSDYSFEYDFLIEVESQDFLKQFGKHTTQIHGIEYQKKSRMTMLASKLNKKS